MDLDLNIRSTFFLTVEESRALMNRSSLGEFESRRMTWQRC